MLTLGRITAVFGIQGWLKVYSHTQPMENILQYRNWTLQQGNTQTVCTLDQGRKQGRTLVVSLKGTKDRDAAQYFVGADILVPEEQLPNLEPDEYYWYQLENLSVVTVDHQGRSLILGKVDHLLATGSNDVLVVKPTKQSIDKRERLIPYLMDQVVRDIDLVNQVIQVDWDLEF